MIEVKWLPADFEYSYPRSGPSLNASIAERFNTAWYERNDLAMLVQGLETLTKLEAILGADTVATACILTHVSCTGNRRAVYRTPRLHWRGWDGNLAARD